MDEEVLIRPAAPADAPAIAKVHIQSWKETYSGIVPDAVIAGLSLPEREGAWRAHLAGRNPKGRFTYVAQGRKGVLGFASGGAFRLGEGVDQALAARFDGEFQAIYLLREGQGKGTGRRLFRAVCGEMRARGFKAMLVWVLKDNPARGFYERMGGRRAAEMKVKIGIPLAELGYGWDAIP